MNKFLAKIRRIINPYYNSQEFSKEPQTLPIVPSVSSSPRTYNFSEIPNLSCTYDTYDAIWNFEYEIEGQNVVELFQLRTAPSEILQRQKNLEESGEEFAWYAIGILPRYKRKKIMSFIMLNIILCILKSEEEKNICFRLGNTSYEIDPQNIGKGENLKIYDSILTQYDNDYQYEIYPIESRKKDIKSIESKLIQIKKHLSKQFPNVNF
jgi:hypothetical protein